MEKDRQFDCNNVSELLKQIAELQATLQIKDKNINSLEQELQNLKEFFGYEKEMDLKEMRELHDNCEMKEMELRNDDPEYDKQCLKSDELSDLVIQIGELQFQLSECSSKIKELVGEKAATKRKNFVKSFDALKAEVREEDFENFTELLQEWIHLTTTNCRSRR